MNNSAAKVGEIFQVAGAAFNKLSEMTMLLHSMDDSAALGGKWSDEEVEMLRGCVNRFAVELNKISQHIKNRTMPPPGGRYFGSIPATSTLRQTPPPPTPPPPPLPPERTISQPLSLFQDDTDDLHSFNPGKVPPLPPVEIMQPERGHRLDPFDFVADEEEQISLDDINLNDLTPLMNLDMPTFPPDLLMTPAASPAQAMRQNVGHSQFGLTQSAAGHRPGTTCTTTQPLGPTPSASSTPERNNRGESVTIINIYHNLPCDREAAALSQYRGGRISIKNFSQRPVTIRSHLTLQVSNKLANQCNSLRADDITGSFSPLRSNERSKVSGADEITGCFSPIRADGPPSHISHSRNSEAPAGHISTSLAGATGHFSSVRADGMACLKRLLHRKVGSESEEEVAPTKRCNHKHRKRSATHITVPPTPRNSSSERNREATKKNKTASSNDVHTAEEPSFSFHM